MKMDEEGLPQTFWNGQFIVNYHTIIDIRCLGPELSHVGPEFIETGNILIDNSPFHRAQESIFLRELGQEIGVEQPW